MAKPLQLIDKMVQFHGGLVSHFDKHGIIPGHAVAFDDIGNGLNKRIELFFLIRFHAQVYK